MQRFGVNSPTFQLVNQTFKRLLSQIEGNKELDVWRGQWRALLSKVYGSDIGDDILYIRHTYLSQFAKLLAYVALEGRPQSKDVIEEIMDGQAFYGHGVSNIGENDFFSWLLIDNIRQEAITLLYGLSAELQVYDLSAIRQDLLKQLYQNLVDPETRHDLGEYYTPDWLAQLTLRDIDYQAPKSLLDPACGSGTFLFNAIRRLADSGLTGQKLVQFALNNIVGIDVHPLAVTIARINYLLALTEHLKEGTGESKLLPLPVFMADALIKPLENHSENAVMIPVDLRKSEMFQIPVDSASDANKLTETIQQMDEFAKIVKDPHHMTDIITAFRDVVQNIYKELTNPIFINIWASNLQLLTQLIHEGRNGIWAYILTNLSRPLILAEQQFDVIVGNPPWLSYRYIKSETYQQEVKDLYLYYKLIESDDVKLFTQMDLSTLFFAHARDRYLKDDGILAFVMPRSVITGAKQHRPFQAQGMTRILDLLDVQPLFNVPSAVLIFEKEAVLDQNISTIQYRARFKKHELPLSEAEPMLSQEESATKFVDSEIRSPYHAFFKQGATLVPRNLCFVRPIGLATSPAVETDRELNKDSKKPWKGLSISGVVSSNYLYATILSKYLLSFGFQKLNLVALPVKLNEKDELECLNLISDFAKSGHIQDYRTWFRKTEDKWSELKKESIAETLVEYLNYRNKITSQNAKDTYRIIYNSSGSNIVSTVLELPNALKIYGRSVSGLVVDTTCYYYNTLTLEEAHYLCSILNSSYISNLIKAYQPEGTFGARHIHRTPFEACAIPTFNKDDIDHQNLVRLSIVAHEKINEMKIMDDDKLVNGYVVTARRKAREIVQDEINAIDDIAKEIIAD